MKLKLMSIPVVLYPYVFIPVFIAALFVGKYTIEFMEFANVETLLAEKIGVGAIVVSIIVYNILTFIWAIALTACMISGKFTLDDIAKANMMVKFLHIPAYLFNFALGLIGSILGVFGIGFILWAVLADMITIALSGIVSFGFAVRAIKEKELPTVEGIILAIGSFIYCVDIVLAVTYKNKILQRSNPMNKQPAVGHM
ncbi:hypothetical protein SAMN06296386_102319 [Lachnospiraceae bacterium]|nr:hypothetical protein SAMN06296386_102319 [Lachnospiraceae bacterium]